MAFANVSEMLSGVVFLIMLSMKASTATFYYIQTPMTFFGETANSLMMSYTEGLAIRMFFKPQDHDIMARALWYVKNATPESQQSQLDELRKNAMKLREEHNIFLPIAEIAFTSEDVEFIIRCYAMDRNLNVMDNIHTQGIIVEDYTKDYVKLSKYSVVPVPIDLWSDVARALDYLDLVGTAHGDLHPAKILVAKKKTLSDNNR